MNSFNRHRRAKNATSHQSGKTTRGREVTAVLRQRIISGQIRAGERLRQDAVAREFGVSAIPVREAFKHLEALGLISVSPHRGAVVRDLSPDEIADLFSLRATVEAAVLKDAIPRMSELDFAVLERAHAAFSRPPGNDTSIGELNWRFHSALYAPSGRHASLAIIETLHARTDRYQRLQLALKGSVARATDEHRRILELCRAGRRSEAVELLASHILSAGAEVIELLRSSSSPEAPRGSRQLGRRSQSRRPAQRPR